MMLPASSHDLLSPHFTLAELTFSDIAIRHGLDNTPSQAAIDSLKVLALTILEPARAELGPIRVNSGFRSLPVNRLVGGSPTSQHMRGEAADIVPLACTLADLYRWLYSHAPFQQLIHEFQTWVHVSTARGDEPPARQALVSKRTAGGVVVYRPVNESDGLIVV